MDDRLFHTLLEAAPDAVLIADRDGRIVLVNSHAERMFGYAPGELLGASIEKLVPERLREAHAAHRARFFAEPKARAMGSGSILHGVRRDATRFPVEISLSPLEMDGMDLVWSAVRDVGDRVRLSEELDQMWELSQDLLCIAGMDGYFLRVNPAWQRITGFTPEELTREVFLHFIHPDDRAATVETYERQRAHGAVVTRFHNRYRCRDGSYRTLLWTSTPVEDRIFAAAHDVTEREQNDRRIEALHRDLTTHAAQLEVANRELESFTYSVSHDLRAPLRAIDGFSRILEEEYGGTLDGEGRRLIGVVRANAVRMARLIDDLLQFSRLGRRPLAATKVDMQALAEDAFREVAAAADGGDRVRLEMQPLPEAWGDPALLRQVWTNLLSNAVKFSAGVDAAVIEVGGREDGASCEYHVRDHGAGFDMRYAGKLFGVFQRLHSDSEFPGTGVGLAIVQRVVARHGGRVWAEGAVDAGATFHFSLPREEVADGGD